MDGSKFNPISPLLNRRDTLLNQSTTLKKYTNTSKSSVTKISNNLSIIPREVTSIFHGFDKLNAENWITWKGHMQDNLEICNLWEIVIGQEKKPIDIYTHEEDDWITRKRIARVIIKNSLGPIDYQ